MLEVKTIDVRFDDTQILYQASLAVSEGEIVAVLGPSGSGKSTLLRAIAGLVDISAGDIRWEGATLSGVAPHLRGFGLMFQGYALFPHMSVAENIGFGLRMKGQSDPFSEVATALELVGLAGFGERTIDSLSGGERQRVALARTLAPHPSLVMLDEPLGALDRNLRQRLVEDTHRVLREREVTGIVVTHDRDEAVALSDRLVLMRNGQIVQSGSLAEILGDPADEWVREFLE
jgi:ABC-type Fe3+/spermidine/putrescine transport system ATPase subunit